MSGQEVTGELLGALIANYVAALSSKGILEDLSQLPTQRDMVVKLAGERSMKAAIEAYRAAVGLN